jgi:diphthamide synthase (EF-2-diphthine--ammonia ligase)
MEAVFPLWQEDRGKLAYEIIDSGFEARITVVDTSRLSDRHLGEMLTKERLELIRAEGADICGENGEYHTFVSDGPIFARPVRPEYGEPFMYGQYAILPMK